MGLFAVAWRSPIWIRLVWMVSGGAVGVWPSWSTVMQSAAAGAGRTATRVSGARTRGARRRAERLACEGTHREVPQHGHDRRRQRIRANFRRPLGSDHVREKGEAQSAARGRRSAGEALPPAVFFNHRAPGESCVFHAKCQGTAIAGLC